MMYRFREEGELKYIEPSTELQKMERNSLEVSFEDIEQFDQALATTIIEDYYRYNSRNRLLFYKYYK